MTRLTAFTRVTWWGRVSERFVVRWRRNGGSLVCLGGHRRFFDEGRFSAEGVDVIYVTIVIMAAAAQGRFTPLRGGAMVQPALSNIMFLVYFARKASKRTIITIIWCEEAMAVTRLEKW